VPRHFGLLPGIVPETAAAYDGCEWHRPNDRRRNQNTAAVTFARTAAAGRRESVGAKEGLHGHSAFGPSNRGMRKRDVRNPRGITNETMPDVGNAFILRVFRSIADSTSLA
jgi:hypothetical protein